MLPFIALAAYALVHSPQQRVSSLTGDVRIIAAFHSNILGNDRDVAIYLPPDYKTRPDRHYAVLYMGDGQNVFDGMTSFLPNKEWRVDETAQALIDAQAIEPIIVVAAYNAGAARGDEYLPTRGKMTFGGKEVEFGGKLDQYGKFLTDELMPYIDGHFRTKRGPQNTGLAGSSLGGIMALYLGLTRPEVFGKLGVVSPSLWWDDQLMLKQVQALGRRPNLKIWMDIGTAEGDDAVANTLRVGRALQSKGWTPGKNLLVYVDKGAIHNEDAWAKRMGMMLMFLFPRR